MSENFFDKDRSQGYEDGNSREGRNPQNENNPRRPYGNDGERAPHAPRQRFSRPARPAYGNTSYGGYQRGESSYRPRFDREGGYRQQGGGRYDSAERPNRYGERDERPDGYRPRFDREGGYTPRENRFGKSRFGGGREGGFGERREEGGYRPRFNSRESYGADREGHTGGRGGYGHPERHGHDGEAGGQFRPRFRQERDGGHFRQDRPERRGAYDRPNRYSQKKRQEYKESHIDPNAPIRLNRFLANAGICSRRDADKYIEAGVVSVNGEVVTELGTKVLRSDEVRFHDTPVKIEKKVYVLLNKPKGYVTTSEDPENRKTVMDLVKDACPERIYPVGRLDRGTTGVLLLTNDGDLATKLTHPKYLKKKIYHVTVDKNVSYGDLQRIADGIELEDGVVKADEVAYADASDKSQVGIEIHSGKNRIVRRIFESLGYHVVKLDRVYFAGLTKKNVRRGDWRYLTEKEVNMLHMGAFE